ncbi:hypothetical protein ZOSMA_52G00230 [Zostera marina]|uniref:Uncharacterized protein n=1 Tax=Zostera marina TaxID=29655 RepID=A0A0K9NZF0_ZOSMR|nr:hypothetical protein ZOSMA_52G00230 [Zostera marina]
MESGMDLFHVPDKHHMHTCRQFQTHPFTIIIPHERERERERERGGVALQILSSSFHLQRTKLDFEYCSL